ncbi:DNA primase [Pseudovibrio sp. W64]|uniref:DNA primase n=1 Tax=Pseudovibrio sp. W64 TaxID=1735583 RepID=UPI0007AEC8EB|nr:DNA primase [Pseudovibrio sp. W64]KZK89871.1 DNA primase [Pseudovibrio sp. W64]
MRFDQLFLDDIRNRVSLTDVVGRRVTWDRRKSQPGKGDYWACCPFHSEKSPSFHVDERRNRYKCFGCGESGDHFKFLMETEGLSFPEAVEELAGVAGIAMPAPDPQAAKRAAKRNSLTDVCEMAARYFRHVFQSADGRAAQEYVQRRGLSAETLNEFQFGFAPPGRDNLKKALMAKDVTEAELIEVGLLIKPEDGRPSYDRFRNRLMIPIHDDRGRAVAFGGRTMDPDGQPKYLNSPETPVFHKGTMLFNAHRARQPAYESGQAIVVEGYMDAIALWQVGIKATVASLGTAFTEDQIMRLWKFADEPVVCFDGDVAGISAAHRAVDRILPVLTSGKSFQFAFLPDGQDPDDVINAGGTAAMYGEIEKALPLSEVVWRRESEQARIDTPERKAALEKAVEDLVGTIKDERVQKRYRMDLRLKLSNLFYEESRRNRGKSGGSGRRDGGWRGQQAGKGGNEENRFRSAENNMGAPNTPAYGIERIVIGMSVVYLDLLEKHFERISLLSYNNDDHVKFMESFLRVVSPELGDETVVRMYDSLGEHFYQILGEAKGFIERFEPQSKTNKLISWDALGNRAQILKENPPEDFVEMLFLNYADMLELRMLEQELEHETRAMEQDLTEESWGRFQALTQDLARRREDCLRDEQELAERAAKMRSSKGSVLA